MAVTPKTGTGTPPGGAVPPQAHPTLASLSDRLDAVERRQKRVDALVGETGGRIGDLLVALIHRHNWLEQVVSIVDGHMNVPFDPGLYDDRRIPPLSRYRRVDAEAFVTPPRVEVPEVPEEAPVEEADDDTEETPGA